MFSNYFVVGPIIKETSEKSISEIEQPVFYVCQVGNNKQIKSNQLNINTHDVYFLYYN